MRGVPMSHRQALQGLRMPDEQGRRRRMPVREGDRSDTDMRRLRPRIPVPVATASAPDAVAALPRIGDRRGRPLLRTTAIVTAADAEGTELMGWGGFTDPREQAAANEAAAKMAQARAAEDSRTEALATAIIEGFGLVADAIRAAAGAPAGPLGAAAMPRADDDECSCDETAKEWCPVHGDGTGCRREPVTYVDQIENVRQDAESAPRDDIDDLIDEQTAGGD